MAILPEFQRLEAGLPVTVPGVTVDRQCGSGLEAINIAARLIQSGAGEVYLAGGVESTSRAPWKMAKPQTLMGYQSYIPVLISRQVHTATQIWESLLKMSPKNMQLQEKSRINIPWKAIKKPFNPNKLVDFNKRLYRFKLNGEWIKEDECPRANTSMEKLQKLPPVFQEHGTVTAGNACPLNDGAALLLMMSREKCEELNLKPILRVVDAQAAGVDPNYLGIGPIPAV